MSIAAIIPALNEAETIGPLVRDLLSRGIDLVIVVDGKSTDGTREAAQDAGAMVIINNGVSGLGNCILIGMKAAMARGDIRRIITIDAGGSHNPEAIPAMLRYDADIVIGSRFCAGADYSGNPRREFASRLASAACRFVTKKKYRDLTDWTSGYRVYSRAAAGKLIYANYTATGHAFQLETLTKAIRLNMTIKDAPIRYIAGRSSLTMKSIDEAFQSWLELAFV